MRIKSPLKACHRDRSTRTLRWASGFAAVLAASPALAQRVWYELTDMGPPRFHSRQSAYVGGGSVSALGDIAGYFYDSSGSSVRTGWIQTLSGGHALVPVQWRFPHGNIAVATNNQRHVAGMGLEPDPEQPNRLLARAYFTGDNGLVELFTGLPVTTNCYATDLNNLDQVVGYYSGSPRSAAYIWSPGEGRRDLPSLGNGCCALAIANTDSGWIAGVSPNFSTGQQPVVWIDGQVHALPLLPLDTRGFVRDIADRSGLEGRQAFVAGSSNRDRESHSARHPKPILGVPVVWRVVRSENGEVSAQTMLMQGLPGGSEGEVEVVNGFGDAAGYAYTRFGVSRFVIWRDGQVYDYWDVVSRERAWGGALGPSEMHDNGQIWGGGQSPLSDYRPFVLTPADLVLGAPVPGYAGRINTMEVRFVEPGTEVKLYYSTRLGIDGYTLLGGECTTMGIGLVAPVHIGSATADENGRAVIRGHIPSAARGKRLLFQAACTSTCDVSDRVEWEFQ